MTAVKPGLQKLYIPQTRTDSPKAAIANNLRTATPGASHGIFAQRSLTGSGIHLNNMLFNSSSISATRHGLNDNRVALFNNIGDVSHTHHSNDNNDNKLKFAMLLAMLAKQAVGQTKEAVDTVKAAKAESKKDVNVNNDPAVQAQASPTPGSITAMKGAKDSSTLRDAIGIAKGEKSKMEADLKALEAKLPSMKEASEAATKQLEELKPKVAEAKKARDTAETNKEEAESNKNASEKSLKNAEERLQGAKDGLLAAKNNLVSAKQSLGTAKANLSAAAANIDPKTNAPVEPAYSEAKQAVTKAEAEVNKAQAKLEEASNEYKAADENDKKAQADFNKAVEQLANNEQALAEMTAKFEKLDGEYKKLEGQQAEAQKKVDEYNEALKNQADWKSAIAQFEAEIPAQEKRLTELETKEEKGYDAATNTINKLAAKGDVSNLKGKDKEKYNSAMNLRRNVSYKELLKTTPETIGGKNFRTGKYNGETLYMIGTKPVDEQTFKLEKQLAEAGQKIIDEYKSPLSNY